MDKHKKITDLGLKVYPISQSCVVLAEDLLELLDSGVEVSSYGLSTWTSVSYPSDTHSGLVIGIKELKPKQVTITRADLINAYDNAQYLEIEYLIQKLGL